MLNGLAGLTSAGNSSYIEPRKILFTFLHLNYMHILILHVSRVLFFSFTIGQCFSYNFPFDLDFMFHCVFSTILIYFYRECPSGED